MNGLVISEPWLKLILSGEKTWEIRRQSVDVRDSIGLVSDLLSAVVATARIADCLGPLTYDKLVPAFDRHCIPPALLRDIVQQCNNRVYAWVLSDVVKLPVPVPVKKAGKDIWIMFENEAMIEHKPTAPQRINPVERQPSQS